MAGWRAASQALAVLLFVSGCSGPGETSVQESVTSPAGAAEPVVSSVEGAIAGQVVDDELRPIEKAVVTLKGRPDSATTDATGTFVLNALPPGTYDLFADAIGYEAKGRRVLVAAAEILQIEIVLAPDPVVVPYILPVLRTFYMDFDQYYVSPVLNGTAHVDTCSKCSAAVQADPVPVQVQN